jgi:hypothetical protein
VPTFGDKNGDFLGPIEEVKFKVHLD